MVDGKGEQADPSREGGLLRDWKILSYYESAASISYFEQGRLKYKREYCTEEGRTSGRASCQIPAQVGRRSG